MINPYSTSRVLVCIMYTDLTGQSVKAYEDDFLARQILAKNRNIQHPIIELYSGKMIKEDNGKILSTFTSATDSVLAAAAIQYACKLEKNIEMRIGIHLSEIIFEHNGVFGDGLEIASQIHDSSPLGSVYISESVQKNLANKKGIETKFAGMKDYNYTDEAIPIYEVNITTDYVALHTSASTTENPEDNKDNKSIAVLPFENINFDLQEEYFSDGITEEILNSLSNFDDLKVICRSSSFQFKGTTKSPAEIAEILDVTKILTGSVSRQHDKIHIAVKLIDALSDSVIWSETYNREMTDIFELQDEIALAIIQKLKVTFLKDEKKQLTNVPTENLHAYELFLKGQYYWNKRGRWLMTGLQLFQEAVALDPQFAMAHAGIADAYSALGMYGIIPPLIAMPKAKEAAKKAIAIDPDISQAFTSLAFVNGFYDGDHEQAAKNFTHGIGLSPNLAPERYWYSFYLTVVAKDFARAEEEGFKSILLEPHNAVAFHIAGLAYLTQRKFDDAMILARKAIEIDSALFLPYFLLGWCQIETKDYESAIETLNVALNLSGRHSWPLGLMIMAKVKNGEKKEARTLLNEVLERDEAEYFSTFGAVIGCIALNENELALSFLEKGYKNKDILIPIFSHFELMPATIKNNQGILDFFKKIKLIDP